ncbi:hypothetical protein [Paenibacillus taichungensis]
MFRHIITTKEPTQWDAIRKEAEDRTGEKLSDFTPSFVRWKDIMLNTSDPVDQVTNAALWARMRAILLFGRRDRQILVIQASPDDLDDINTPINPNELHKSEVKMKHEIIGNSIIYASQMGETL